MGKLSLDDAISASKPKKKATRKVDQFLARLEEHPDVGRLTAMLLEL